MSPSENILSLLYKDHDTAREQTAVLQEALVLLDSEALWTRLDEIFAFFNTHVAEHFMKEEVVLDVAAKYRGPGDTETVIFKEILREHSDIRKLYRQLISLRDSFNPHDKDNKENFVKTFNDLVDLLLKHVEKEDRLLYPLLNRWMDEPQREEAWKRLTASEKRKL
jgi:hemerythrin-like domain-containing protein